MFCLVSSFDVTSIYFFQYAFNQYLVKFPFAFLTQDLQTHNMFEFEETKALDKHLKLFQSIFKEMFKPALYLL